MFNILQILAINLPPVVGTSNILLYAQAGFSNGKQSEHHLTHQNSQIDSETLTINTQGNVSLKGAIAKANRINAEIKGDLTIDSLQDIHQSESDSTGFGGRLQGAIGSAWGGSAYGNLARGEANRKQVTQQSGLFAEEGGYHINANNVDLVASVIASTNSENSELATNKLSFRDIENQSSSEALNAGVSASANLNKAAGTEAKTEAQAKQQAQTAKLTGTPQSNGISPSIPMFDSSEDRCITKATLTEGKITLNKDSNPTQTTAQALGINTDLSQANQEVAEPKDIHQTLREQQILSQAAGNVAEAVMTYAENQKAELQQAEQKAREAAEEAANAGDTTTALSKLQEAEQLKAEVERWETGGDQKRKATAVAAALSLAVAGKPAEAIAAGAASPYLNEAIKHITENTDNKALEALNVPLHILWGAVEAELAGGSATAGAVAAGVGELGAKVLAETVYGKQPSELNEEEKQNLLNASKALAGVASGVVSGGNGAETLANASVGMVVAENAVENNFFDDLHPSEDRKQTISVIAKALFSGDEEKAEAYYDGLKQGEVKALIEGIEGTVEAVQHFDETIVTIAEALGNPKETVQKVVISLEELNARINSALETNPAEAGELMGYLQSQGKALQAPTVLLTGEVAEKVVRLFKKSPQMDYKSDVNNLGGNNPKYNKELNEAINNRSSEHYINEQASKRVNTVTEPIDFDGHIINGEIKNGKVTKIVGGHSALGNVKVDKVIKTYPNGVYEAKISVKDPSNGKYFQKTNNGGISTMFPKAWTSDRIKVEVDQAFKNRTPHSDPVKATRGMWEGRTPSGIKVEGYLIPKVTVYPTKEQ